jgi:hypothetical protein
VSTFTSIPIRAEEGDQIDVSVSGIRVDETVAILMSPEQFDSFGKNELQPCEALIRLTPEEPRKRVKVPHTSLWHIVFINEESSSARVARIAKKSQEENQGQSE